MKVTIDRSKWLRGERDSYLLRPGDQRMCCLGFCGLALGLTESDIWGEGELAERFSGYTEDEEDSDNPWPWLLRKSSLEAFAADYLGGRLDAEAIIIQLNDAPDIDDATRETWLTQAFGEFGGVELEFVDGGVMSDDDLTGAQLDAYFAQCIAADKIADLAQELSRETRVEKVRGIVAEIGLLCGVCIEKAAFISGESDG